MVSLSFMRGVRHLMTSEQTRRIDELVRILHLKMDEVHCTIKNDQKVEVVIRCHICGEYVVHEVSWEWAATASHEDFHDLAICPDCIGEEADEDKTGY